MSESEINNALKSFWTLISKLDRHIDDIGVDAQEIAIETCRAFEHLVDVLYKAPYPNTKLMAELAVYSAMFGLQAYRVYTPMVDTLRRCIKEVYGDKE